jgi:hydrogenase expression/formation protein HypE
MNILRKIAASCDKIENSMRIGKLDNDTLQRIVIDKIGNRRPEVLVRPGIGEDCAVVDFGEYTCVLSTDPITASAEKIGALAVTVSCNDIATRGIEPLGILLTVLLPPSITETDIEGIMEQAAEAALRLNVEIIGGHTEITDTVKQPVITATAIGRGKSGSGAMATGKKKRVSPGDQILVTKHLALEGTGIIAAEREAELSKVLTPEELVRAKAMLDDISVVREGVIVGRIGFSAMHDITEGGVLGALWEVCTLSGVGAVIEESLLPIDDLTRKISAFFGLNSLRLISSGSMMIFAPPVESRAIVAALSGGDGEEAASGPSRDEGPISVTVIGEVRAATEGIQMVPSDGSETLPIPVAPPESDEIYRVLSEGKNG